jgi:hypothetical protein
VIMIPDRERSVAGGATGKEGDLGMKPFATLIGEKTVYVRSYLRLRYGKWETVVSHSRRPPRR